LAFDQSLTESANVDPFATGESALGFVDKQTTYD
jgi:hypothetical protein